MEPYIGEIRLMGFPFAPKGWAFCQGQLIAVRTNQALFSLLGTTYGGDGQNTFGLPDLRGRAMLSFGQGPGLAGYIQGQMGGTEGVSLLATQIPQHTHSFTGTITAGDEADNSQPNGTYPATGTANEYSAGTANGIMGVLALTGNAAPTGGSQPHENRQPVIGMNYAIALQGIFPSRG